MHSEACCKLCDYSMGIAEAYPLGCKSGKAVNFATDNPTDDFDIDRGDGTDIYRGLFNNLLNGLAYCRLTYRNGEATDLTCLAVNSVFSTLTGLTNVVGKPFSEVIPGFAQSDAALIRRFARVAATSEPERFEYFVGALQKWLLISAYSPKAEHVVVVFDDVTARKQIEETLLVNQAALRQSEEHYRTLIEWTPIALIVHAGGKLIYANPAAIKLAGARGLQDMLGRNVFDLVHPEFREIAMRRSANSAQPGGMSPVMEQKYLKLDGTVINVEVQSASIVYDGVPAVQVVIHDITARKQAEQALVRVNRALTTLNACNEALIHAATETDLFHSICRLIVETGGYQFAWIAMAKDVPGGVIAPVASFGKDLDYLKEAKLLWSDDAWVSGPTAAAVRSGETQINQQFPTERSVQVVRDWANKHGLRSAIALPLPGENGPLGAFAIYATETDAFDESEIKLLEDLAQNLAYGIKGLRTRAESAVLADQLRKLSLIVEQSPESIVITNLEARIEYVNEAFVRNTGYRREEAIGQNPRMLQSKKTPQESYDGMWKRCSRGAPGAGISITGARTAASMSSERSLRPFATPMARSRTTWR